MQGLLADAIARAGYRRCDSCPSGAGHEPCMFDGVTEVGMLFVRCGNGGVSHSPRETITAEDADRRGAHPARHNHELRERHDDC